MTPSPSARRTSIATERTHTSASSCWPSIRRSSARCRTCCGRETMFRISRWIAVGLLLTTAAYTEDRYEKTMSGSVSYPGGKVTIEHRFGRVEVRTWNSDTVTARAIIRSSDAEWGKQIHFSVLNGPDGVTVSTTFPEGHYHGENRSYSVDLAVTIPQRAPLRLTNRFGTVAVAPLRAPAELVNGHGTT